MNETNYYCKICQHQKVCPFPIAERDNQCPDFKEQKQSKSVQKSSHDCSVHGIREERTITFSDNEKFEFFGITQLEREVMCKLFDAPHSINVKIRNKLSKWINRENHEHKYGRVTTPEATLAESLSYFNQSYFALLHNESFWEEHYPKKVNQHFVQCMKEALNCYFEYKQYCFIDQLDLEGNPLLPICECE